MHHPGGVLMNMVPDAVMMPLLVPLHGPLPRPLPVLPACLLLVVPGMPLASRRRCRRYEDVGGEQHRTTGCH